jgi:CheY-like chemotaxis protein
MNTGHSTDVVAGQRLTVLVVEDHADTLEVVTRILRAKGYRVLPAASWCSAIELGVHESPDVLIADAQLPDGHGWDLLALLRERHPQLVGIALTAHGFPEHVQRSRLTGFCAHLTKPVSVQQLVDALAACVAARAA